MNRVKIILPTLVFGLIVSVSTFFIPAITPEVSAQVYNPSQPPSSNPQGARFFQLQNPLKFDSFSGFISALLNAIIAIGIPIAVLFVVLAGFKFVTAQGKPEELKSARSNLVWTLVGIGIFLGAALIASIIQQTLRGLGVNI